MALDTVPDILDDIREGKMVILMDDEDRENEGDLVIAAEKVTPEIINFFASEACGLICMPITAERARQLRIPLMVRDNRSQHETNFTVSIDATHAVGPGVSASQRAHTILEAVKADAKAADISQPGHIFPLVAKQGGVLRRTGHTEAAIDFARLAGLKPAGVIVEIMNEDGTMARLPELIEIGKKLDLKIVSIEDLVAYRMQHDSLIEKKEDFEIKTRFGDFRLRAYQQTTNNQIHLALTKGQWKDKETVLTRINSTLINNDILGTLTNNVDKQLDSMFKVINDEGKGAIIFINQESQSMNILKRLDFLKKNQVPNSLVKAPRIEMDSRDFGIGAQILHDLNIHKLKIISNSEQTKRVGLIGYGLEIIEYVTY